MDWAYIAAAVATSTALHGAMEPDNVLRKLRRLNTAIRTGKIEDLPMKGIDTRAKSYSIGISMLAIVAVIAYFIINAIEPELDTIMIYSVVVLAVGELILMARLDQYHVEIEKITQKQKKK